MLKIFKISKIEEKRVLNFHENYSFLSVVPFSFIFNFKSSYIHKSGLNLLMYERNFYECDLKYVIYNEFININEISSIMINLSDMLMVLSEADIKVSNIKSSNIVYINNEDKYENMKICDLCLNMLRSSMWIRI